MLYRAVAVCARATASTTPATRAEAHVEQAPRQYVAQQRARRRSPDVRQLRSAAAITAALISTGPQAAHHHDSAGVSAALAPDGDASGSAIGDRFLHFAFVAASRPPRPAAARRASLAAAAGPR